MAEPTQYAFELKELTETLIKLQGIKEGKWAVGFEFNLGAGVVGLTPENPRPGALVIINKVLLTRHTEGAPELPFVVDAGELK